MSKLTKQLYEAYFAAITDNAREPDLIVISESRYKEWESEMNIEAKLSVNYQIGVKIERKQFRKSRLIFSRELAPDEIVIAYTKINQR